MVNVTADVTATTPEGPFAFEPIVFLYKLEQDANYTVATTLDTDENGNVSYTYTGLQAPAAYQFMQTSAATGVFSASQAVETLDTTVASSSSPPPSSPTHGGLTPTDTIIITAGLTLLGAAVAGAVFLLE